MKKVLIGLMAMVSLTVNAVNNGSLTIESPEENSMDSVAVDRKQLTEINLYEFEFRFLPVVANSVSPDEQGVEILIDTEYLMREILPRFGCFVILNPNEIKTEVVGDGNEAVVVWQMPQPEKMPLAGYIAFVPEKESDKYKVFYLESSINFDGEGPAWVLGVMNDDGHANYGSVKDPQSPENFVKLIRKLVYHTK